MTDLNTLASTADPEWVDFDAATGVATVGITDYAADKLGDVVFVDLPSVGSAVTAGDVCGEIESTKSVGELYAPLSGDNPIEENFFDSRDVQFFASVADESDLVLGTGAYAVFYPTDIHRPGCIAGVPEKVRKVVVKILA